VTPTWPELANRVQVAGQAVFGEPASYAPANDLLNPVDVVGIFDAASARIMVIDGVEIETTAPVLVVHLADLVDPPAHGAQVTVRSVVYRVTGVEPDGQGDAALVLSRANP